jgi:hypothetical protein
VVFFGAKIGAEPIKRQELLVISERGDRVRAIRGATSQ